MRRGGRIADGKVRLAAPKALALLLALLIVFSCAASAFAKSGDAPSGDTTTIGASPSGDTTTIGASPSTSQEGAGQASQEGAEQENSGESDAELERRKEIYTIGAMITLGAILVGIREKRNRR
jgi:hypothetical protein